MYVKFISASEVSFITFFFCEMYVAVISRPLFSLIFFCRVLTFTCIQSVGLAARTSAGDVFSLNKECRLVDQMLVAQIFK